MPMRTAKPYTAPHRHDGVFAFLRTGSGLKSSLSATVVPVARATGVWLCIFPPLSYATLLPATSSAVRVVTMSSDTAQRELRASPLKPKLANVCKPECR